MFSLIQDLLSRLEHFLHTATFTQLMSGAMLCTTVLCFIFVPGMIFLSRLLVIIKMNKGNGDDSSSLNHDQKIVIEIYSGIFTNWIRFSALLMCIQYTSVVVSWIFEQWRF
jgi:hypothetical protein